MTGVTSTNAQVRAEACGKIILLGEHFVIPHPETAESPAIALPLPGLKCTVEIASARAPSFVAEGAPPPVQADIHAQMALALAAAARAMGIDARSLSVRSRTNLPLARGFGSSAAFSVALSRALGQWAGYGTARLKAATHAIEAGFHGTPSGLDTAVILAGRAVRFHRGEVVRTLSHAGVDFVAVDAGPRDSAVNVIARVRQVRASDPGGWSQLSSRVSQLVDASEAALATGDARQLGDALSEAHHTLATLGLSTSGVEAVLADARRLGGLGGKVSGAGGGGAVLLVAPSGEGSRLARSMTARGHSVVAVTP